MLALVQDNSSIHQHVGDPNRVLVWVGECGRIRDTLRVEQDQVGVAAGRQTALAVAEPHQFRRPANGNLNQERPLRWYRAEW